MGKPNPTQNQPHLYRDDADVQKGLSALSHANATPMREDPTPATEPNTAPFAAQLNTHTIEMFGNNLRRVWTLISVITIFAEIVPVLGLPPTAVYTYKAAKIFLFFVLGYLTPLAFHKINKLSRGLSVALGSAVFVEVSQALIGNGHHFSVVELVAKVSLIIAGFAIALNARYDQSILVGSHRIQLHTDLIPRR